MSSFVYFLRALSGDGPIKIGSSYVPEMRLRTYMMWSPQPLEIILTIPGDVTLERQIHNCFADMHSHCEWFFPGDRLLGAIRAMSAGEDIANVIDLDRPIGNVLGMTQRGTRNRNGTAAITRGKSKRLTA